MIRNIDNFVANKSDEEFVKALKQSAIEDTAPDKILDIWGDFLKEFPINIGMTQTHICTSFLKWYIDKKFNIEDKDLEHIHKETVKPSYKHKEPFMTVEGINKVLKEREREQPKERDKEQLYGKELPEAYRNLILMNDMIKYGFGFWRKEKPLEDRGKISESRKSKDLEEVELVVTKGKYGFIKKQRLGYFKDKEGKIIKEVYI